MHKRLLMFAIGCGIAISVAIAAVRGDAPSGPPPVSPARAEPTFPPPPPEAASDPALYNPMFASLFRAHGPVWDQNLHPGLQAQVEWQRKIGPHAWITGHGVGNPGFAYDELRYVISVWNWDHTDLFELGLPRIYEGKQVVITELSFGMTL